MSKLRCDNPKCTKTFEGWVDNLGNVPKMKHKSDGSHEFYWVKPEKPGEEAQAEGR